MNYIPQLFSYQKEIYNFVDNKKKIVQDNFDELLRLTLNIFNYKNLPETIDKRTLELYLILQGYVAFIEKDGKYYITNGALGSELNYNYIPRYYIGANPYIDNGYSYNLEVGKDCIVIKNDLLYSGLNSLLNKYATLLADNEITIHMLQVNKRATKFISAANDSTKASAEVFLNNLEKGRLGIIGENPFTEDFRVNYATESANLTELIEMEQYLLSSYLQRIGLQSNYNMKRESLNSNETQLNDDFIHPLVDEMLECRQEGIERINAKYGLDISVEFNSSWYYNQRELETEMVILESETEEQEEHEQQEKEQEHPTEEQEEQEQQEQQEQEEKERKVDEE